MSQLVKTIENGEEGATSLSSLIDLLLGAEADDGDIIYRDEGVWKRLAKDTDGKVMTLASGLPSWEAAGVGGSALPFWVASSTTAGSTSTVIPNDDTDPQSGEGGELITCTITPTSTDNYLLIRVSGWLTASTPGTPAVALFLDSESSATAADRLATIPTANFAANLSATFLVPVTSTSAQTWKVRIGLAGAGLLRWLQTNTGELFSTTDCILMTVQEISIAA